MNQGIYLLSCDYEVACGCRLATAGRLEVDHRGSSHGGWDRRAAISDRVLAWNGELIDTAIDLTLRADGVVQCCRVEIDLCGLQRQRGGGSKWRLALRERRADSRGYGDRVAMPVNVHVKRRRVGAEQMVVQSGDVDAGFKQL